MAEPSDTLATLVRAGLLVDVRELQVDVPSATIGPTCPPATRGDNVALLALEHWNMPVGAINNQVVTLYNELWRSCSMCGERWPAYRDVWRGCYRHKDDTQVGQFSRTVTYCAKMCTQKQWFCSLIDCSAFIRDYRDFLGKPEMDPNRKPQVATLPYHPYTYGASGRDSYRDGGQQSSQNGAGATWTAQDARPVEMVEAMAGSHPIDQEMVGGGRRRS